MENLSNSGSIRRTLSSLVPLSFKTAVNEHRNRARLAKLLRAKGRFRKARKVHQLRRVPHGVNLVAYIRAEMGLGVAARGMASALDAAGIPFNVINFQQGNYSRHTDYSWSHKEVRRSTYDITIVCVNPDNSFNLRRHVPTEILGDRYVIGYWFWELPELPVDWLSEFEFTDEVWSASHFIKDAVSAKSPAPVMLIPPVVQGNLAKNLSRSQLSLPDQRFLFLAMFDSNSVLHRKNPLGVVQAFKSAFPSNDPSVGLVLKFNNPDYQQPILQALKEEITDRQNIFVIDRTMSREEVISLISVSDCYVSLHRSEGFGLGPAEAMRQGKPAMITNWSGNTDYMTDHNSIPIDYELVNLGIDYGPYKSHQYWAEPDLEHASYWMKRIARDPELAREIGERAQHTIISNFSPSAVGKLIDARLEQIRTIGT